MAEIDFMEYSSDAAAQAAYVTDVTVGLNEDVAGSNTLLINFNGADAATTYTAETGQTVTFVGTAQLDTAQSQFGPSSLLLDGNSDYVSVPDSDDWNFGTGNFTIDFWVRWNGSVGDSGFFEQYIDNINVTEIFKGGNILYMGVYTASDWKILVSIPWTPSANIWYHVAFERIALNNNSSDVAFFIDGAIKTGGDITLEAGAWNAGVPDRAANLNIGTASRSSYFHNGWIDSYRVLKGTARWTTSFTAVTLLQSYSEATIKTQGSYALKGVATITDSLNKTLTKTFVSPLDLTGITSVYFDTRASRTGSNLKFGLHNTYDSYTKLCSTFDGADAATAYTDPIAGAATFVGTAQLDTAQKKFGTASLLLDGDSDYITYPDSADWTFGTGNFTIDFWLKINSGYAGTHGILGQFEDGTHAWRLFIDNGSIDIRWYITSEIARYYTAAGTFPNDSDWHHVAVVRNGTVGLCFVDGVSKTFTEQVAFGTTDLTDIAAVLNVGGAGTNYTNGWIEEPRISKGIARWTSNFTPPTHAYVTTHEITPNITSADTFQGVTWDLSGVADANKNNIDTFIITVINADA